VSVPSAHRIWYTDAGIERGHSRDECAGCAVVYEITQRAEFDILHPPLQYGACFLVDKATGHDNLEWSVWPDERHSRVIDTFGRDWPKCFVHLGFYSVQDVPSGVERYVFVYHTA